MSFLEQKIRILEDSEKPDVSAEKGLHILILLFGVILDSVITNNNQIYRPICVLRNIKVYTHFLPLIGF